ncbi:hypothetical protein CPT_Sonora_093 [Stenotrophomonas phage Sonora]|nr:hypothetical protein CPT_Sonora_093 [Stenotrophomonas phage Sonora]
MKRSPKVPGHEPTLRRRRKDTRTAPEPRTFKCAHVARGGFGYVWGHGASWIVTVRQGDDIIHTSRWFLTEESANLYLDHIALTGVTK